jgi:hypothetical protein
MLENTSCSVCDGVCLPLDVIDFNRSGGAESRGQHRPLSGIPIYYYLCEQCGFCFAPEFRQWSSKDFSEKIYNEDYSDVDPNHVRVRPEQNALSLTNMFKGREEHIKHIDYGGGNGLLANLVSRSGWNSISYDPFITKDAHVTESYRFNLITAFEVFEHISDVHSLMTQLESLLDRDGIILFSTLLSDGEIVRNRRLSWWYASPRNGHISLFSRKSMNLLASTYEFRVGSFSPGLHMFFRELPHWGSHLIKPVARSQNTHHSSTTGP